MSQSPKDLGECSEGHLILLSALLSAHPEDTTATEDSLTDVAITNVLTDNFKGADIDIEVRAKVLYEGDTNDIVNQYIIFCKVIDEQTKQHGMTQKAGLGWQP